MSYVLLMPFISTYDQLTGMLRPQPQDHSFT